MKYLLALLVLLAGCTTAPEPAAPPETPPPSGAPSAPSSRESIAVASLMENARAEAEAGKLINAAATLERALRIEPRNPRLWHELARVRLKQGEFTQAESVALRSSSWAGGDNALRAENWRLIAQAREARGDRDGARAALDNAERIAK